MKWKLALDAGFFVVLDSVAQRVDDCDVRVYLNGAAVENGGAVAPFADRG